MIYFTARRVDGLLIFWKSVQRVSAFSGLTSGMNINRWGQEGKSDIGGSHRSHCYIHAFFSFICTRRWNSKIRLDEFGLTTSRVDGKSSLVLNVRL